MTLKTLCVAEFSRSAINSCGGDCKVRIYKIDGAFVPSFYNEDGYVCDGAACETYGSAVAVAIEWIDNSDFHL